MRLPAGVIEIRPALYAFYCACCGRQQAYARPGDGGGITTADAKAIGWRQDATKDECLCPFCADDEGDRRTRSVMGSRLAGRKDELQRHTRPCAVNKNGGSA